MPKSVATLGSGFWRTFSVYRRKKKDSRRKMFFFRSFYVLFFFSKTMQAHNFRELEVWQLARGLVKDIYGLTARFPASERFGLTSQLRRAAVSVPSNIAEGSGRSDKDFVRFLAISLSSAYEVETQLILACDLQFVHQTEVEKLIANVQEIQRMIYGLQRKLTRGFLHSLWLPLPILSRTFGRYGIFLLTSFFPPN
ncbi:four helix bundle protein [Spirosoma sp. 209]|uniref:four helix bundle protein n=1 Tax=Spirosoma sp. 209 TaxID=1955701 RepID=UPI001F3676B6|nr:four helix bundle protein [Spirosoma sp. 209]